MTTLKKNKLQTLRHLSRPIRLEKKYMTPKAGMIVKPQDIKKGELQPITLKTQQILHMIGIEFEIAKELSVCKKEKSYSVTTE